jgi:hypothetical protein
MSLSSERQAKVLEIVLARSATDRDFRRRLLTDPRGAIHDACGVHVPQAFRIRFIERGADLDALIVLPDVASDADASGELSDAELESIAGGATSDGGDATLLW